MSGIEDAIGTAAIVYGAAFAEAQSIPTQQQEQLLREQMLQAQLPSAPTGYTDPSLAVIVYGAPPQSDTTVFGPGRTAVGPDNALMQIGQRAQRAVWFDTRDQWWKWAVGAGIVSVGAYAIYKLVTEGRR